MLHAAADLTGFGEPGRAAILSRIEIRDDMTRVSLKIDRRQNNCNVLIVADVFPK